MNYRNILNACYNIINAQYDYCISNTGLFEESDKEENVGVAEAATASCSKRIL